MWNFSPVISVPHSFHCSSIPFTSYSTYSICLSRFHSQNNFTLLSLSLFLSLSLSILSHSLKHSHTSFSLYLIPSHSPTHFILLISVSPIHSLSYFSCSLFHSMQSLATTPTHSVSLSLSISLSLSLSHTHTHCLSHTRIHPLSLPYTLFHTPTAATFPWIFVINWKCVKPCQSFYRSEKFISMWLHHFNR